ncbi:sugar ABC transporter ATP-binding protein [Timonella senegalensis]|uniref:sugar ABC transporter ATP-binding protein n=1 Tax=Timonella senegalensis TaxID=1465825 RepID=UPI0028A7A942|nr:sugar ABC transporter ATP-binding protein [Timonella senegalensis]
MNNDVQPNESVPESSEPTLGADALGTQDSTTAAPALELVDIVMSFGSNRVLKGVDLTLHPGRITALLGANGAGKSTLIKILAGVYSAVSGEVRIDGVPVEINRPLDATANGLQTVHQRIDDSILPGLTVAENLVFEEIARGQAPKVSSLSALLPRAREIASSLSLGWSDEVLRKDVYELGIADCQLLLLARALVHRPKVLILDEPTSTLSGAEADRLYELIFRLRDEGVAILYVSHRMGEIKALADDVVVLRDGRIIDEQHRPFDLNRAVAAMLGQQTVRDAEEVVENRGETTRFAIKDVQLLKHSVPTSVELRAGEVTGIIGLIGAGKTELAEVIYGANTKTTAHMELNGKPYAPRNPKEAISHGVYLVPEDRAAEAMLPGWSISSTLSLPFLRSFAGLFSLNTAKENRNASDAISEFGIVSTGPDQPVDALSGGNQQKVIVARWMREKTNLLVLDEPFRGVDIGARRDISHRARELASRGACVAVLVSDVEEVREVADRIIVLVEGEARLDAYTSEITNELIISTMSEVSA